MKGIMDKRVSSIIKEGVNLLEEAGVVNARSEATLLLRFIKKWQMHHLMMNMQETISQEDTEEFINLIKLRKNGYPLQYITGTQEFMGLAFEVNPNVLIPRYDTEVLVEAILSRDLPPKTRVVDVGTGSGAIAISLAKLKPEWEICAIDISEKALEVADKNSRKHNVRITFFQGDLLESIKKTNIRPDLIVSNPPYIPALEIDSLMKEVQFEPYLALQGGEDGLAVYRRLIPQAFSLLGRQGCLALEIGYNQGEAVSDLCKSEGFQQIEVIKDYQSHDRVVIGVK
ncbi:peptide chain release factor N(5)-glutamine methyltransferase [Desulfitibacter alkalitolerans]|uniref:peptide chain release factor N(5)-glutamine methyltransferase n=1 Tax=Desulfitibacter alkalitolerans TaxID=264641 RepID=UPI000A043CA5|nr:peptide chain release factor N(5)-glutamine methyltransferase [Desulfitibacter alkalitolerans]